MSFQVSQNVISFLFISCHLEVKRVVEWTLFEALSLVDHLHIITSFCCRTEMILLPIVVRPSDFAAVSIPDYIQGAHYYLQWMTLP
jgi:hypothetical protein